MINLEEKLQKALKFYEIKEVHPATYVFPLMTEKEYDGLVEDAKENGFFNPVIVNKEGVLLDGRNRLCASMDAKVPVEIKEYTPDNPVKYIRSMSNRRSINYAQRKEMERKVKQICTKNA